MAPRRNLVTMLGGAAVFGTVAGLTAGVATAAPSQTDGAMLYMCQDIGNPSSYRITVKGTYPMDSADAAGYLIHMNDGTQPGGLIVELKADDASVTRAFASLRALTLLVAERRAP